MSWSKGKKNKQYLQYLNHTKRPMTILMYTRSSFAIVFPHFYHIFYALSQLDMVPQVGTATE